MTEALITIDKSEIRSYEAEAYRLKGELLLTKDRSDFAEAQSYFYRAIETAWKQGAKSFELRATSSIARLLRDAGRCDEARAMLAEIYGWFTGFSLCV